jgi:hypothetical protein
MTKTERRELFAAVVDEQFRARADRYCVSLSLDLSSCLAVVANLQLAFRHPGCTGPAKVLAEIVADAIIAEIRADGFPANADLCKLGYDPSHDE